VWSGLHFERTGVGRRNVVHRELALGLLFKKARIDHAAILPPVRSDIDLDGVTLSFFAVLFAAGLPNNAQTIKVIFQLPYSPTPNNLLGYVFWKRDPGATLMTLRASALVAPRQ
jgi:hypothetical protein